MPSAPPSVRRIIVLGSTGSVGRQTLEVIAHLNDLHAKGVFATRLDVVGLAAGHDAETLNVQASRFSCPEVAIAQPVGGSISERARVGPSAAGLLVEEVDADMVVSAIVGFAGLEATLAALERGRDVALANKESLVAAGSIVVDTARRSGARLLPVDSEHAGVWQCLRLLPGDEAPPLAAPAHVSRIVLTASGGPFRTWTREQADHATPEQALAHPTWRMGAKISVDCASLMNKSLELIEAHWLFEVSPERLGAIIHPESIVHAIVEHADGSVVAQMASTDMRGPIQHALAWPEVLPSPLGRLDLARLASLRFEEPDLDRFPALALATEVMTRGGNAGAILSAANEAAVAAFLQGLIPFGRIVDLACEALDAVPHHAITDLDDARKADDSARRFIRERCG